MNKIINNSAYIRSQFSTITGMDFEIISTIDHPYVSPPMRLVNGHALLYEKSKKAKICILNWNVSQPNDRTYNYDM